MSSIKSGKMGRRNQRLTSGKLRLKLKMEEVTNEKQKLISKIDAFCENALTSGNHLLMECNEQKFFQVYKKVAAELDETCQQLFLVDLPEPSDGSDLDEESFDDFNSCVGDTSDPGNQRLHSLQSFEKLPSPPVVQTPQSHPELSSSAVPPRALSEALLSRPCDRKTSPIINKLGLNPNVPAFNYRTSNAETPVGANLPNERHNFKIKIDNHVPSQRSSEVFNKIEPSAVQESFVFPIANKTAPLLPAQREQESIVEHTPVKTPPQTLKPVTSPDHSNHSSRYQSHSSLSCPNSRDSEVNSRKLPLVTKINSDSSHPVTSSSSQSSSGRASVDNTAEGFSAPPLKATTDNSNLSIYSACQNDDSRCRYRPPLIIPFVEPQLGVDLPVIVSHVDSPSEFYIQIREDNTFSVLNFFRQNFARVDPLPPGHVPLKYGFYLALFDDVSPIWYRVHILKVYENDPTPSCQVFYIDYGNQKKVPFTQMALLDDAIAGYPALAFYCCLQMTAPMGETWTKKSTSLFSKMLLAEECLQAQIYPQLPFELWSPCPSPLFRVQFPLRLFFPYQGRRVYIDEYIIETKIAKCATAGVPLTQYKMRVPEDFEGYVTPKMENLENCAVNNGSSFFGISRTLVDSSRECASVPADQAPTSSSASLAQILAGKNSHRTSVSSSGSQSSVNAGQDLTQPRHEKHTTPERKNSTTMSSHLMNGGTSDCRNAEIFPHPFLEQCWSDNLVTAFTSCITDPHNFSVHLTTQISNKMDDMQEEINNYYNNLTMVESVHLSGPVAVGSFWACRYPEDSCWYRVQIQEIFSEENNGAKRKHQNNTVSESTKLSINFVDWGNTISAQMGDLRPLLTRFCSLPSFAVPCSLAKIFPKAGDGVWSREAVSRMTDLVGIQKTITLKVESHNKDGRLEVLLWTSEETQPDKNDILINNLLVEEGLASSSRKHKERPQDPDHSDDGNPDLDEKSLLDKWDPMSDEFNSERNSYLVDVDDPEVATTGYKSNDGRKICHFYSSGGVCPRGNVCHLQHIRVYDGVTRDSMEELIAPPPIIPKEGSNIYAQVSSVVNPSRFYIILPYGNHTISEVQTEGFELDSENIEELSKAMTRTYSNQRFQEDYTIAPAEGSLVAARNAREEKWLRATITAGNQSLTSFMVFFVDFGTQECVERRHIAKIRPEFIHLPYQALECSLDLAPNNPESAWTGEAIEHFSSMVRSQDLVARTLEQGGVSPSATIVQLYQKKGKHTISICDELIKKGHAVHIQCKSPQPNAVKNNYPG